MFKATYVLALGVLLASGAAEAAAFNCATTLEGYDFSFSGAIQGDKVIGQALMIVTQADKLVRRAAFVVSSSQFTANQTLAVNATGESNSKIVVNATFNKGTYNGPMTILSDEGNIDLSVVCSIK